MQSDNACKWYLFNRFLFLLITSYGHVQVTVVRRSLFDSLPISIRGANSLISYDLSSRVFHYAAHATADAVSMIHAYSPLFSPGRHSALVLRARLYEFGFKSQRRTRIPVELLRGSCELCDSARENKLNYNNNI